MAKLFGMELHKTRIRQYFGSVQQIAGMEPFCYTDGKAAGVRAIDVKTGSGLRFKIIQDRGMDIADAEFKGVPISWLCKNGIIAPSFFENSETGFLRSFTGGLFTTCGLTQVGTPCQDGDEFLGLHGRISNTPAQKIHIDETWKDDEFTLTATGIIRESRLFAENLVLTRQIQCILGESKIFITDTIENEGFEDTPLMILYHYNFGYPIVSKNSRFLIHSDTVKPANDAAMNGDGRYDLFVDPTKNYAYECFVHTMQKGKDAASLAVINESMNLGVYITYHPEQLPFINEWKMMGEQDYVLGVEPANCLTEGRSEAGKNNRLQILKAGEKKAVHFEFGVLENLNMINEYKKNQQYEGGI